MVKPTGCKSCKSENKLRNGSSWLSAMAVMILPKCPFCVMAYSSAITMCGTSSLYLANNNWVSYFPILLSLFVCAMLWLNYRGKRTLVAMIMALSATLMVTLTHQLVISPAWYHVGNVLLFFSIFVNGPMLSVINTITKHNYMKSLTTKLSSL